MISGLLGSRRFQAYHAENIVTPVSHLKTTNSKNPFEEQHIEERELALPPLLLSQAMTLKVPGRKERR